MFIFDAREWQSAHTHLPTAKVPANTGLPRVSQTPPAAGPSTVICNVVAAWDAWTRY